jgi:scyllo-inositol 2-dehydrogenase (NADP+)
MSGARFESASDVRVGVVGYGGAFNMGRGHLNEMASAGMTPCAVTEIDESRLEVAKQDFPGIQMYNSVEKMLAESDVNLVTIITPHNTHADLALKCLQAGKHVVCEKPMAITTEECDAMVDEAKKQGLVLSTYHNRHWDGCILTGVKLIKEEKVIGDVFRIEAHMCGYAKPGDWWRTSKTISGGILYDWGVHLLEYSLQLIDGDLAEVSGYAKKGFWADQTKWKDDTNEDEAHAIARFSNGNWLTLTMSSLDAHPKRGILEITGTKGSYVMDHGDYEIITKEDGETRTRKGRNTDGQQIKYYQNIADHLTKGTALVISPEWSRRPIHIIDLACKSAEAGAAMKAKHA